MSCDNAIILNFHSRNSRAQATPPLSARYERKPVRSFSQQPQFNAAKDAFGRKAESQSSSELCTIIARILAASGGASLARNFRLWLLTALARHRQPTTKAMINHLSFITSHFGWKHFSLTWKSWKFPAPQRKHLADVKVQWGATKAPLQTDHLRMRSIEKWDSGIRAFVDYRKRTSRERKNVERNVKAHRERRNAKRGFAPPSTTTSALADCRWCYLTFAADWI